MPLIFLCWLAYSTSYLGKVDYSANISLVIEHYGISHAEAGLVSTMFFFAYGAGQIVNAFLVKHYNLRYMVFGALLTSGAVNLAVGLSQSFEIVKYLWVINGIALSTLWPSLIRLLSESVPRREMSKATVAMGTTVAIGTFIIYGLSAIYATFTDYRLAFYTAGAAMISVAFIWLFSVPSAQEAAKALPDDSPSITKELGVSSGVAARRIVILSCFTFALFGVATNLIKDGLVTWVPSILKEQYNLEDSLSIVLTLALPLVSIFGNAFAVKMNKKIRDLVVLSTLCFTVGGIILGGIIAGLNQNLLVLILIGFALVCFLASTSNSIITSIFPLYMKKELNSGFIAGILNGFCYLGSTISSYGLGAVADNHGWISVFYILLATCAGVFVIGGIYLLIKTFIKRCA